MASKRNYFDNLTKPFDKTFLRQKQFAFLTTAAALFCLLCFVSSIFLKEFETTSYVDISASGDNPGRLFENAIAQETTGDRLADHIELAASQTGIGNEVDVNTLDMNQIRDAFKFSVAPNRSGQQYRLSATYTGTGARAEQVLTDVVIYNVAQRLSTINNLANALDEFDKKYDTVQNRIESNAQSLHNELDQTNDLVNDLNSGLSDVHQAVESIRPQGGFEDTNAIAQNEFERGRIDSLLSTLSSKIEEFKVATEEEELNQIGRSIANIKQQLDDIDLPLNGDAASSMRIINAALPESNSAARSILDLLGQLDTDTIQARIGQVQNNLRAGAVELREDVSELRTMTNRFSESRFVVNGVSGARTRPSAKGPNIGHIFVFGFIAMIGATFVATYYRPELENCGFESIESIQDTLSLPVVSEIVSDGQERIEKDALGNKIVRYCEVGLFGFVLLSAILCFIQPDIRDAFFESPFYGMSKIANLFF